MQNNPLCNSRKYVIPRLLESSSLFNLEFGLVSEKLVSIKTAELTRCAEHCACKEACQSFTHDSTNQLCILFSDREIGQNDLMYFKKLDDGTF